MRLPRWIVVFLLVASAIAILAAGAWWWITWPDRTISEFRQRINAGQFVEADSMIAKMSGTAGGDLVISGRFWRRHPNEELLFIQPRSLVDWISSRATCKLASSQAVIVVQRSMIRAQNEYGDPRSLRVSGD